MFSTLTIADWCILLAGLVVPFIFTIYAKATKTFDNAKPREYMERLDGARIVKAFTAPQAPEKTHAAHLDRGFRTRADDAVAAHLQFPVIRDGAVPRIGQDVR